MRVHRSNRMEALGRRLAEVLQAPTDDGDALEAIRQRDVVVVHSQGMARWLSMELARHLGVCANVEFPFPKAMIRQSVGAVLGEGEDAWKTWRPDALLWRVLEALEGLLDTPAFAPLATYLARRGEAHGDQAPLVQVDAVLLAREIADIFDRYVSYRPDLIAAWEAGEGETWQPILWRAMRGGIEVPHLGAMVSDLDRALRAGVEVPVERLPPRICLFGIATLPPFYLDLFGALSRIREVHLFLLCPSNLYWGDIRDKGEQAQAPQRPAPLGGQRAPGLLRAPRAGLSDRARGARRRVTLRGGPGGPLHRPRRGLPLAVGEATVRHLPRPTARG